MNMAAQEHVIAVVDDDSNVRKALARLLSVLGYRVELFASADDFLIAAPASRAACVLLDIQLGAMSGLDLARRLASAGLGFPIIFMTGSTDDGIRRQCMDLPCVAFLPKPVTEARLMDAIAKAVDADPLGCSALSA
jgi:FixJ family two-component response regulator